MDWADCSRFEGWRGSARRWGSWDATRPDDEWQNTPSSVIYWWFIPVAHLFMPFKVMNEVVVRAGRAGRTHVVGWWLAYLAARTVQRLVDRLPTLPVDVGEVGGVLLGLAALVFWTAATALAILLVRSVAAGVAEVTTRGTQAQA